MKQTNPERAHRRWLRAYESEARVLWTRSKGCIVAWCARPTEMVHVKSRGAGGTADDTVAMCRLHHRELHQLGIRTFERLRNRDLTDLAAQHALRWREASKSE